ncbi:MAG TPA: transcription factor S [Methanothrix sp.]|nr:transcription factor S [Methanothrix sp.]HOV81789.1 transcription factor S [Methanothrix sp.]HPC89964.1 transcription factor S [Methanothrix sp.]HQE87527.1 transcription factor S [Methanothrix sp.]HQI68181.1 transcription factor S [Methanothrix sp.]
MDFCPQCKSMMMPKGGMMVCRRCGYEMPKAAGESLVSRTEQLDRVVPVLEQESAGLPTTAARCPDCGNNVAYWWLRQLRSADESEVRFFRCTKCNKTWREYD